jgi:hypothetical protein
LILFFFPAGGSCCAAVEFGKVCVDYVSTLV